MFRCCKVAASRRAELHAFSYHGSSSVSIWSQVVSRAAIKEMLLRRNRWFWNHLSVYSSTRHVAQSCTKAWSAQATRMYFSTRRILSNVVTTAKFSQYVRQTSSNSKTIVYLDVGLISKIVALSTWSRLMSKYVIVKSCTPIFRFLLRNVYLTTYNTSVPKHTHTCSPKPTFFL